MCRPCVDKRTLQGHCFRCGRSGVQGKGRMYCADCGLALRREQWRVFAKNKRRDEKLAAIRAMRRAA